MLGRYTRNFAILVAAIGMISASQSNAFCQGIGGGAGGGAGANNGLA